MLCSVLCFEVSHFLSIITSKLANLFNQRIDLLIFKGQLSVQNFEFGIFFCNSSMQIVEFGLGVLFDFFHGCGIMLKVNIFR